MIALTGENQILVVVEELAADAVSRLDASLPRQRFVAVVVRNGGRDGGGGGQGHLVTATKLRSAKSPYLSRGVLLHGQQPFLPRYVVVGAGPAGGTGHSGEPVEPAPANKRLRTPATTDVVVVAAICELGRTNKRIPRIRETASKLPLVQARDYTELTADASLY